MPDHIRALIVIMLLSILVFAFASRPACAIMRPADFVRRRNLWLLITLVAFLAHDFWLYILITGLLILFFNPKEANPVALFFFLLFTVPIGGLKISGLGIVNHFFTLTHLRLLALVILLPVYIKILEQETTLPFGRTLPDKLISSYLILVLVLYLRETSITDTLRQGFYLFVDIFLPYYVISRLLKTIQDFREALVCLVTAVMILALIGLFEIMWSWLLYDSAQRVLGIHGPFTGYQVRSGLTRASASVRTISLGYVTAVSIGVYFYLQRNIRSKFSRWAGMGLLVAGLLAALSRGPWVGAIIILLVFILTGQNPVRSLVKYLVVGVIALPLLINLPDADKFVDLLPYVGTDKQDTISYRENLIEKSLIVIERHPFLGSVNYLDTREMESMRQGQGIIDIVNTYIGITLESGIIGVSLFTGFFITICWGIYRSFRRLPDKNSEEYLLGRALFATLVGILLIIFTVSSVSIIPIVYWSVAGLGVAYINMMVQFRSRQITNN